MRRKKRVKGRTRMEEVMVWESFMFRRAKNWEEGGNPAAYERAKSRFWMEGRRVEKGRRD